MAQYPQTSSGGSARVIYASGIAGVALDCVIATGSKIGGGTPTDNSTAINAVLATATADNPICLVMDGGAAMHKPLVLPATGHVAIVGLGWDTGFFMLAGANASGIQNFPDTDLAEYQVWNPTGPQSVVGSNFIFKDFRVNGNRANNVNGTVDGTLTGYSNTPYSYNYRSPLPIAFSTDPRGNYNGSYWLSGIVLMGAENVAIDNVWVYDIPTYHINLYHCRHIRINDCRLESPGRSGNTDGVHINGGCYDVKGNGNYFATGDDAFAFNFEEGDALECDDICFTNSTVDNCITLARIYGQQTTASRRVTIDGVQGSVSVRGVQIGSEGGSQGAVELNHLTRLSNFDVKVTSSVPSLTSVLLISGNAGVIEMDNCLVTSPTVAMPFVLFANSGAVVSTLRLSKCGVHRTTEGSAAVGLLSNYSGSTATIGNLYIDAFRLTQQSGQSYTDIPILVDLSGLTINKLSLDAQVAGVATVINLPSTGSVTTAVVKDLMHQSNAGSPTAYSFVGATSTLNLSLGRYSGINLAGLASGTVVLTGPGVITSGYAVADALMGNGTPYLGSGHSNGPCIKLAGTARVYTIT